MISASIHDSLADARAYVGLLVVTALKIQGASGSPLRALVLAP
jgi:kynurenine formamidase